MLITLSNGTPPVAKAVYRTTLQAPIFFVLPWWTTLRRHSVPGSGSGILVRRSPDDLVVCSGTVGLSICCECGLVGSGPVWRLLGRHGSVAAVERAAAITPEYSHGRFCWQFCCRYDPGLQALRWRKRSPKSARCSDFGSSRPARAEMEGNFPDFGGCDLLLAAEVE